MVLRHTTSKAKFEKVHSCWARPLGGRTEYHMNALTNQGINNNLNRLGGSFGGDAEETFGLLLAVKE